MRTRMLPLACVLGTLAPGAARAAPEALKGAAVETFRTQAKGLLDGAASKAQGLRARASQPQLLLPGHKTAVRHEIAVDLVQSRKSLRKASGAYEEWSAQHALVKGQSEATDAEAAKVKASMEASHGQLSWLAKHLKLAIAPKGRAALARYKQDKAAYEILAERSGTEKRATASLEEKVAGFEQDRQALTQKIAQLRQRDWKGEADQRVAAEVQHLEADAAKVEAEAKTSIHGMVSKWVADQMKGQRDPIQAAANEAASANELGGSVENAVSHAQNAVRNAQNDQRADQVNDAVEMLVGRNGLQDFARKMNDVGASIDSQRAQSALRDVNSVVSRFQQKVAGLQRMTAVLQHGGGPGAGAAARVDTNVALVAYVDLALDFTRFDGAFSDFLTDQIALGQLNRAESQLSHIDSKIGQTRAGLRQLQQSLGDSLKKIDGEAADVVQAAVGELTKPAP